MSQEFIIKKFDELTLRELYEISRVRQEVFVVEQNCPFLDFDGKDYDSTHIFSKGRNEKENRDEITSYTRVLPKGLAYKNSSSIGRVLVNPKYRNQGLARKNMNVAIKYISEPLITISAQEYLIKFYESLGFKIISERYLEDDIPHFEMELRK